MEKKIHRQKPFVQYYVSHKEKKQISVKKRRKKNNEKITSLIDNYKAHNSRFFVLIVFKRRNEAEVAKSYNHYFAY